MGLGRDIRGYLEAGEAGSRKLRAPRAEPLHYPVESGQVDARSPWRFRLRPVERCACGHTRVSFSGRLVHAMTASPGLSSGEAWPRPYLQRLSPFRLNALPSKKLLSGLLEELSLEIVESRAKKGGKLRGIHPQICASKPDLCEIFEALHVSVREGLLPRARNLRRN